MAATDPSSYLDMLAASTEKGQAAGLTAGDELDSGLKKLDSYESILSKFNIREYVTEGGSIPADSATVNPDYSLKVNQPKDLHCSVCGKQLKYPSESGTCSLECRLKAASMFFSDSYAKFQETIADVDKNIDLVANSVTYLTNSVLDMKKLMSDIGTFDMTSMYADLDVSVSNAQRKIDDEYMVYMKAKSQEIMAYLKMNVNNVLIWKNKLLIKILEKYRDGINSSSKYISSALSSVALLDSTAQSLNTAFNNIFGQVYKMITTSMYQYKLAPESINFFCTPRSMVKIPTMKANQLVPVSSSKSITETFNFQPLEESVMAKLPPIKNIEYFETPDVFKARLKLSPLNEEQMNSLFLGLQYLFEVAEEPLPEYKNLKVSNLRWVAFLLSAWGPMGKQHFGFPLYP